MSSYNQQESCRNCYTLIDVCYDTRDGMYGVCYNCGYRIRTTVDQISLEELNEIRRDINDHGYTDEKLEPLTELPKFNL